MITTKSVFYPTKEKHNIEMSAEAQDFISQLLEKEPEKRLGTKGDLEEILAHDWLKNVDIEQIKSK